MSHYIGDFALSSTVRFTFNTSQSDGTPITLAGSPAVSVYKNGATAESTSGVTLSVDFDGRTGFHLVTVDTSSDGTFYATASDFHAVITAGTVDSISVVGAVVGGFSLQNRSSLRPTVAGRTLDVSSTGEAGVDWGNVGNPTTSLALAGTTISTSQAVASVTGSVGSLTGYVAPDNSSITAIKAKTDNLPSDPADESLVIAATDAIYSRLGAPAGASVSADVAAVKLDTSGLSTYAGMLATGTIAASPSPTSSAFKVTLTNALSGSEVAADIIGLALTFVGGARQLSYRRITGCTVNSTTSLSLTFTTAFAAAPTAGDACVVSG